MEIAKVGQRKAQTIWMRQFAAQANRLAAFAQSRFWIAEIEEQARQPGRTGYTRILYIVTKVILCRIVKSQALFQMGSRRYQVPAIGQSEAHTEMCPHQKGGTSIAPCYGEHLLRHLDRSRQLSAVAINRAERTKHAELWHRIFQHLAKLSRPITSVFDFRCGIAFGGD